VQVATVRKQGAGKVFREVASGAKADRAQLRRLLDRLDASDVVMVTRIDRLARSTFDLFGIVKRIVDAKVQFRSLAEPWANTATKHRALDAGGTRGLADVERDLIRTRTGRQEPRQAPRKAYGAAPSLTPAQQTEADSYYRSISTTRAA
jgi:DNA invertase Pin-like site-specific DNA recombinase